MEQVRIVFVLLSFVDTGASKILALLGLFLKAKTTSTSTFTITDRHVFKDGRLLGLMSLPGPNGSKGGHCYPPDKSLSGG